MFDGCSPASPPSRRAQSGDGPISRTPVRSECMCTVHVARHSSSMPSAVRKSGAPCGPGTTRSVQAFDIGGGAIARVGASAAPRMGAIAAPRVGAVAAPIASRSPLRSGAPPRPAEANVARLPITSGRSIAPRTSTYARRPTPRIGPSLSTAPAGTSSAVHCGAGVAVDLHRERRSRHGDDRVLLEAQARPAQRELDPGRALGVADEQVAEPETSGHPSGPTAARRPPSSPCAPASPGRWRACPRRAARSWVTRAVCVARPLANGIAEEETPRPGGRPQAFRRREDVAFTPYGGVTATFVRLRDGRAGWRGT